MNGQALAPKTVNTRLHNMHVHEYICNKEIKH